tara:strand:+ start:1986 stop:2657 length:672 start_codon:yes stop_codon:yes gene_type:complete
MVFAVITSPTIANGSEKGLLWGGLGEAEGSYQEDFYKINDEIRGTTLEYNEFRYITHKNRGIIPSSKGKTRSFFVHYTQFDPSFSDYLQRTHKLTFTEVIPYWSRGYQYTVHLSKKLDMLTSVDLFLGLGLITFEKEIENVGNYEHRLGYDLSYGYAMNWIFKFDDMFFLGWRSILKNNEIRLDFGSEENFGYLTHRKDIMLVFGGTFSGSSPSCRDTLYVKC